MVAGETLNNILKIRKICFQRNSCDKRVDQIKSSEVIYVVAHVSIDGFRPGDSSLNTSSV